MKKCHIQRQFSDTLYSLSIICVYVVTFKIIGLLMFVLYGIDGVLICL